MAGGITEATLEEIKSRIDLADLIASYGIAVRTAGATKKACCPFHHEKTPSFNINDRKGFYHCFGCGESGDAITFVQKYEGLAFGDAVRKLAERCGVEIAAEREDPAAGRRRRLYALMAEAAQFYRRCLVQTKEAEIARAYLAKRELSDEIAEKYLIGYAPNGIAPMATWAGKHGYTLAELEEAGLVLAPRDDRDRGYHRFSGRLMFTICDRQGRAVAFSGRQLVERKNAGKYVNSPETPIFVKGKVLFGFDKASAAIARTREVIVCEGQIDCIRLQTGGFPNAVAGQGTAFTEEHVRMLRRVADSAVLVYDDDAAGHKATVKSGGMLLAAGMPVRVVSLPDGDDPDSFLRKAGAEAFAKLVADAESIVSFQVRVARAAERNPGSIDAVNRVAHAVLETISRSQNEVLKAAMTGEAAKLMGLPTAALQEELAKVAAAAAAHPARPVRPATAQSDDAPEPTPGDFSDEGADAPDAAVPAALEAERAEPPPPRELALCAFLMANEHDRTLDGILGEFLPPKVFAHDFTRQFVEAWRAEIVKDEDLLQALAGRLEGPARAWFDAVLLNGAKTEASGLSPTDILQDFVRSLWADELKRERGSLPASGDPEADLRRMRLSLDLKRLASVRWGAVKDMIRDWLCQTPGRG